MIDSVSFLGRLILAAGIVGFVYTAVNWTVRRYFKDDNDPPEADSQGPDGFA